MKRGVVHSDNNEIQSIRELNHIIKISQSIINTLDHQKVLQIISDGMSELLEIESAAIYLLVNEEDLYLSATTPPLDPQMPDFLRRASIDDHPHIKKAILDRKPIVLADTNNTELSPAEQNVIDIRQLRSLLYFPFITKDQVLGILILGTCNKSRTFTDHEISLGQIVANQLSVAIQNTRLHEDLKNHKDNLEITVADRTHQLKTANEELMAANNELYEKNAIVSQQKEELEASLSNLKKMQVQLIQAEKMASLGILTAGVAHEINNPLNFIMGAYLGLEDFFAESAPEHRDEVAVLLDGLKSGIERASEIVQGLNQFSRDSKAYNEDCDINSILKNCLVMLNNKLRYKIQVEKLYEDSIPIVKGNIGKMHQVFTNILINAIQAIEDEGQISVRTKKEKDLCIISISDTGKGIEKENIPKITDPFYTTKSPNEGTGLGLSIAYNIVLKHNGQLEFESEVGKGTTVTIKFPLK